MITHIVVGFLSWLLPAIGASPASDPPASPSRPTMEKFRAIEPGWQGIYVYFALGEPIAETWSPAGITWHYLIGDQRVYVYMEQDGTFGPCLVVNKGLDCAIPPWHLERRMLSLTEDKLREEVPIPIDLFPLADDARRAGPAPLPGGLIEAPR
jgi:hypothetical protein